MKRKMQSIIIAIITIFELKSFEYNDYSTIKSDSNILGIKINRSDIFNIKTFNDTNKFIELDDTKCSYIDSFEGKSFNMLSDMSSVSSFSEYSLSQDYTYNPYHNKIKIEEKLDKNYIFDKIINSNNEHEIFFKMILMQGIESINIY